MIAIVGTVWFAVAEIFTYVTSPADEVDSVSGGKTGAFGLDVSFATPV
jgi:hypothetical protein